MQHTPRRSRSQRPQALRVKRNYRVLREGVELKKLPGRDIRMSVQVAAQEQPTPLPTPSTEREEECLELCMNEEPALPPTSRIAAALPRRPISSLLVVKK